MSISFNSEKKIFTIETQNSVYAFQIIFGKYPVHLYYGARKNCEIKEFEGKIWAFAPYHEETDMAYLPDCCMSEYVGFDSGDFRTSSLRVRNINGDSATFLTYKAYNILKGRIELEGLPFADADENTETLELIMVDELTQLKVKLYYTVFADEDIISRYAIIENGGNDTLVIEKCMSLLLDLPHHGFDMISLYGSHYHERNYQREALGYGNRSIFSRRGASSHQFNPFFALCETNATQDEGQVYGFNFVYSGSFLDEVEVDQTGNTRVQIGLGSENFSWELKSGDSFTTPEAVMTYTAHGIGQMSRNFHSFTRKRILPPEPFANRPVVLNTWEACYFDIDEAEMLRFADAAANSGIDMLVMDDGWFGTRNNDKAGLGDWYVNKNKFKDGLKAFVDKVKAYNIKFGIWIEPEMVNPDSDLYRAHPEWCIQCKGREKLLSRTQWVLDMGNPEVLDYLKKMFRETFDGIAIDYFKWDVNRHMSQVGSAILPAHRQGEASYRHMLGVYEFFRWFRAQYPNAMIENCSGGGGRYDLGMMKYSTMIWTSDNTGPHARIKIQYSSMLAYPAATMSCHVSNHRICETPRELKFRYEVAMQGALGYEFHLPNASQALRDAVREEIKGYRKYEDLILRGDYYSLLNPFETDYSAYYYINTEKDKILLSLLQHNKNDGEEVTLKVSEAIADAEYFDEIGGKVYTGKQLNDGVTIMSDNSDCNSQMWLFVKK